MLRVLGPADLEGFVFQSPGAPRCELFAGVISKVQITQDAMIVTIRGENEENGQKIMRSATILFENRGGSRKMLMTRGIAAGLTSGVFVSILSMQRNNQRIAMDFKFSGLWRFKGYKGEINVLFGKYSDLRIQNNIVSFRFWDYNASEHFYYRWTVDITATQILEEEKIDFSSVKRKEACICICGPSIVAKGIHSYNCIWYEMIRASVGAKRK